MAISWTLRDRLPKHGERDGPYRYDAHAAEAAVRWFPAYLRIPDGDLMGQPFRPPPYQEKFLRALYGWRRADGGFRYERGLQAVARGNLKSTFGAGIGIKKLVGDGIPTPKVQSAGTDRDNAAIIFGYAAAMARQNRLLSPKRLRVLDSTKRIVRKDHTGWYRVISADSKHQHGGHPNVILFDDLQAQKSRELVGVLRTSQRTKMANRLWLAFMTAGDDVESLGKEEWDHALEVLEDPSLEEDYLVDMHFASPDDDIEDPKVWRKANPAMGISVDEDQIRKAIAKAIRKPSERAEVMRFHLNIWDEGVGRVSWLPIEAWDATAGIVSESELKGRACWVGVMATSATDFASVFYVFPPGPRGRLQIVGDVFLPEEQLPAIEAEHKRSYRDWVEAGWLRLTPGNIRDDVAIAQSIARRQRAGFEVQEIAVNPRGAVGLIRELEEAGFDVVRVYPGFAHMSPAMNELEKLVLEKRIAHSGHRALRWMIGNFVAKKNAMGDLAPDGQRSHGNITGPVALLSALSRIYAKEEPKTVELTAS